jgi:hypothetical protein
MCAELVRDALDLAARQLERLRSGDIDAYLADADAYTTACDNVAALDFHDPEDQRALGELVGIASGVSAEIGRLISGTSARMRQLSERRRLAAAYYGAASGGSTASRGG